MNVEIKYLSMPYHVVFRLMAQIVVIAVSFFFLVVFSLSGTAGYISVKLIGIVIIYAYQDKLIIVSYREYYRYK